MSTDDAAVDAVREYVATGLNGAREALMLAMLLYGLTQGVDAFADERAANVVKDMQPMVGDKPMPKAFLPSAATNQFGASVPQPPWRSLDSLETRSASSGAPAFEAKATPQGSAWQRLDDYRAQGRVQVLTLWSSPSNMISLQAGKHGGPSLQWSSRSMNRGGATRGLLDRFVASSIRAAASRASSASRGAEVASATKPIGLVPSAK